MAYVSTEYSSIAGLYLHKGKKWKSRLGIFDTVEIVYNDIGYNDGIMTKSLARYDNTCKRNRI